MPPPVRATTASESTLKAVVANARANEAATAAANKMKAREQQVADIVSAVVAMASEKGHARELARRAREQSIEADRDLVRTSSISWPSPPRILTARGPLHPFPRAADLRCPFPGTH